MLVENAAGIYKSEMQSRIRAISRDGIGPNAGTDGRYIQAQTRAMLGLLARGMTVGVSGDELPTLWKTRGQQVMDLVTSYRSAATEVT